MDDWRVVEIDGAYARWVRSFRPTPEVETDMLVWYEQRRAEGPPFVIDTTTNGHRVAAGPNGERIEHVVVPTPLGEEPPYGTIVIFDIAD